MPDTLQRAHPRHVAPRRRVRTGTVVTFTVLAVAGSTLGVLNTRFVMISRVSLSILIALGVLAIAQLFVSERVSHSPSEGTRLLPGVAARLAVAWVSVAASADVRFGSGRDATAVTTGASSANILQMAVWLASGAYAIFVLGRQPRGGRSPVLVPMTAFAAWLMLTTIWSTYGPLTVVRAGQVTILLLLFLASRRLHPDDLARLRDRHYRYFVRLLVVLVMIGLVGSSYDGRFRWLGTHPGMVSGYLAVGVILAAYGAPHVRYPRVHGLLIGALVLLVGLTRTRGTFAALVVAVAATVFVRGRQLRPGLTIAVSGASIAVLAYWDTITAWLARGQATESLTSLTGRTDLWREVLTHGNSLFGSGFAAGRLGVLKYNELGTGHNTWVELISGAGLVGAVLGGVLLAYLLVAAMKHRLVPESTLLVFLLVHGLTSESWALPGLMTSMLFFAAIRVDIALSHRAMHR